MTTLDILYGVIALLFAADAATTIHILNRRGVEKNGFLARIMASLGRNEALLVTKAAALAGIAWSQHVALMVVTIVIYSAVVLHNMKSVKKDEV